MSEAPFINFRCHSIVVLLCVSFISLCSLVQAKDLQLREIKDNIFPFNTGALSDTNSAEMNYVQGCTNLIEGYTYTFSSCSTPASGDPFIRLYSGQPNVGTQVASNDDGGGNCGTRSLISYEVTTAGEYCLVMGATTQEVVRMT